MMALFGKLYFLAAGEAISEDDSMEDVTIAVWCEIWSR